MKLEEIFAEGHLVAFTPGPMRFVVNASKGEGGEVGMWLVTEEAMDAIAYRKRVETEDLAGTLGDDDKGSDAWNVDDSFCWCEDCAASRKMLETQSD